MGAGKDPSLERLIATGQDYKIEVNLSDDEIVFMDSIYRGYPAEAGLLPLGDPSAEDGERAVKTAGRLFRSTEAVLKKLKSET